MCIRDRGTAVPAKIISIGHIADPNEYNGISVPFLEYATVEYGFSREMASGQSVFVSAEQEVTGRKKLAEFEATKTATAYYKIKNGRVVSAISKDCGWHLFVEYFCTIIFLFAIAYYVTVFLFPSDDKSPEEQDKTLQDFRDSLEATKAEKE